MKKSTSSSTKCATRDRIVAVSREFFLKNGHRGVTMEELAGIIGVSKKTLYVYFPTKLAILEAVMDTQFEMVFNTLEAVRAENEANTIVCFEAVIARWQEFLATVQPVFWRDVHLDAHHFLQSTEQRRLKIVHGIFERIIRDGIAKGDFVYDANPEVGSEILLGAIEGLVRSERLAQMGFTTKELILMFIRRIFEGSLTDQGREKLKELKAAKHSKAE